MTATTPEAVIITKPGYDTVRIGPIHFHHQAAAHAARAESPAFRLGSASTGRVDDPRPVGG
ncbi:hypothetical protein [Sphaerimonospora mesophila]|uniref:hypothetical protein n=1 Tax=Sphaerimonospora mesophila TaxID=37483 RepID=UPI0006E3A70D